jgi:hypothetical protein
MDELLEKIDYEELSNCLAPKLAKQLHVTCPMGWSQEDIKTLSDFAESLRKIKSTVLGAVVYFLIIFLMGALFMGFKLQLGK